MNEKKKKGLQKGNAYGKKYKKSKKFSLPDSDTISEWFAQDHKDRLKKIFSSDYQKYDVYQVYRDKGAL